jgi:hypothetical protein
MFMNQWAFQALRPQLPVEALNVGVLDRLLRSDELQRDAIGVSPGVEDAAVAARAGRAWSSGLLSSNRASFQRCSELKHLLAEADRRLTDPDPASRAALDDGLLRLQTALMPGASFDSRCRALHEVRAYARAFQQASGVAGPRQRDDARPGLDRGKDRG